MNIAKIASVPTPALRPLPKALTAQPDAAPDQFQASVPMQAVTRPSVASPSGPIPDARTIAADMKLRYVDLNKAISSSYCTFGEMFQKIVDPGFEGKSDVQPSWYGMAVYASRVAGGSMAAADLALGVVKDLERAPEKAFARVLPPAEASRNARLLDHFFTKKSKMTAAFLLTFFGRNLPPEVDPRVLAVSVHRLVGILDQTPGTLLEKFATVAGTLKNALEDGNRRIFADIGVAAQDHLELRQKLGRAPTTEETLAQAPSPGQALSIYHTSLALSQGSDPLPNDFGRIFPGMQTKNMMGAAMALYEQAGAMANPTPGSAPNPTQQRLVEFADNLMAYHEQLVVAQPAFSPPDVQPGEVARMPLFQLVTPDVFVDTRAGRWRYADFAKTLPHADHDPFTPKVSEHNWGKFEDRWPPIMDFFAQCYQKPASIWPMPNPDPTLPI